MERKIEFRGKRLDSGEWLYGDLMHDNHHGCYVYPNDCDGLYTENKVDPDTVGEFTGLKDKNDKEIYEGDIVRVCDEYGIDVGVVRYNEDFGKYIVVYSQVSGNWFDFEGTNGEFLAVFCSEVIGNIYDTPELLKK